MSYTTATELQAAAAGALSELDTAPLVTLNGSEANSAVGQVPVVLIQPPRTTYETHVLSTNEWTVVVVSDCPEPLDAWPQLDALAELLRDPLDVDACAPAHFQPPHGPAWPALSLTLTTHHEI